MSRPTSPTRSRTATRRSAPGAIRETSGARNSRRARRPASGEEAAEKHDPLTNDQIAGQEKRGEMFVEGFFGNLKSGNGGVGLRNPGPNPPPGFGPGSARRELPPTGPAVGLFPES